MGWYIFGFFVGVFLGVFFMELVIATSIGMSAENSAVKAKNHTVRHGIPPKQQNI